MTDLRRQKFPFLAFGVFCDGQLVVGLGWAVYWRRACVFVVWRLVGLLIGARRRCAIVILPPRMGNTLKVLAKAIDRKPPTQIPHIRQYGLRSC